MKERTSLLRIGLGAAAALALSAMVLRAGTVTVYFTIVLKPGLQLIANPFETPDNAFFELFRNMPDGTVIYKFTNGVFTTNSLTAGQWDDPYQTLGPGEGAFLFNPAVSLLALTFAGALPQGQLTNPIPAGLSLKSSLAFKSGGVTASLSLALAPFDNLYQWQTDHFVVYTALPGGGWHPSEPKISITEAFFVRSARGTNWVQTYQP